MTEQNYRFQRMRSLARLGARHPDYSPADDEDIEAFHEAMELGEQRQADDEIDNRKETK